MKEEKEDALKDNMDYKILVNAGYKSRVDSLVSSALEEERERVMKEIKGMKDDGINSDTNMPHYLEYNKGSNAGWNAALSEVFKLVSEGE